MTDRPYSSGKVYGREWFPESTPVLGLTWKRGRASSGPMFADVDCAWTYTDVVKALRNGCWIEPGGASGYMLVEPRKGFVPLRSEFFLQHKRYFRLEWWRAGWGKKVKKTSKCRYVYLSQNAKSVAQEPEGSDV